MCKNIEIWEKLEDILTEKEAELSILEATEFEDGYKNATKCDRLKAEVSEIRQIFKEDNLEVAKEFIENEGEPLNVK
jgi:DNA-binding SARP family transcriptional activator